MTSAMVYLEDYVDTVESLPLDLQRYFTKMCDLECHSQAILDEIERTSSKLLTSAEETRGLEETARDKLLSDIRHAFARSLQHAEQKLAIATQAYDAVDRHVRKLDDDLGKFEEEYNNQKDSFVNDTLLDQDSMAAETKSSANKKRKAKGLPAGAPPSQKPAPLPGTSQSTNEIPSHPRKVPPAVVAAQRKKQEGSLLGELPVDPNEPTYCYCKQVSFGEMIACDNDNCDIEWFHYDCVGLTNPPKGKWYCTECTQKRRKQGK